MARLGAWLMAAIALAVVAAGTRAPAAAGFERDELIVETADGAHRFAVELATTAEQRSQGLMFRPHLAADAGMLFVYPRERTITMWMKNTLIPLDMLFIAADGRIIHIAERTIPKSMATISSEGPARGVLELNGGTAARLGIKPGDRVRYAAFAPPAD
ncbi:MAG: DUF192 domain-containing protein [Dongiaceae bacterium]